MTPEQAKRLLKAGKDMREAQQAFFRSRHPTDLKAARDLERRFDTLIKECETRTTQGKLFPNTL